MHSTLSHRQFPQGAPSTTSQRTFRALQETQARAARLLVIFWLPFESDVAELDFLLGDDDDDVSLAEPDGSSLEEGVGDAEARGARAVGAGDGDMERPSVSWSWSAMLCLGRMIVKLGIESRNKL